jgi:hypothetical protein
VATTAEDERKALTCQSKVVNAEKPAIGGCLLDIP